MAMWAKDWIDLAMGGEEFLSLSGRFEASGNLSARVVSDRLIALRSTGDSGAYLFVFQGFSEPIGIIAAVPKQPVHIWYAAEQSPSTDIIANLSGGDKEVQRPSFAITDGVQPGIHTAFGSANQAATHPFLTPKLDAVRWAFR